MSCKPHARMKLHMGTDFVLVRPHLARMPLPRWRGRNAEVIPCRPAPCSTPDPVGTHALASARAAAASDLPQSRAGSRVAPTQPAAARATTILGEGERDDGRGPRKRVGKPPEARCQGRVMRHLTCARRAKAAALCVKGQNARASKWLIADKSRASSRGRQRRYASLQQVTSLSNSS
jgi:hypothetical protein